MKKILILISTFFLGINLIYAVNTIPRTDDDLGVNKKWEITEKNIENVKRTPRVDSKDKVYDFALILSENEISELKEKIEKYIAKTNMDMVILITDLELNDYGLEDYAADFYDYNDFGINYSKYSGIILIVNMNSYNRYFNIFTFGEAQAYYYNRYDPILDYIFDDIKYGNYLEGFTKFIEKSDNVFNKGRIENIVIDDDGYIKFIHIYRIPWLLACIISGIVTLIVMIVLFKKNKMIKKETKASVYTDRNSIIFKNKVDRFMHTHTSSYVVSSSSSSSGGSHSGSSGGGHSGGGGRHF